MNDFDTRVSGEGGEGLRNIDIDILQVNLGKVCNQRCRHCHLEASPDSTEKMKWSTMELILKATRLLNCRLVDLTGGAPELNPFLPRFIFHLRSEGLSVQVRTNLTALLQKEKDGLPKFLRENSVGLVGSLPCYLEENVRAQRGDHAYGESIAAIRMLNNLGYGVDSALPLNLVYNPGGPFLPPPQSVLEEEYRRELGERFGIRFSRLFTITNVPLGRFGRELARRNQTRSYLEMLRQSFNPFTLEKLMCRHQLSVGWDGTLFDCDFNLALCLPVNHGASDHIRSVVPQELNQRRIVTGEHCFACTAGIGSSCGGALL